MWRTRLSSFLKVVGVRGGLRALRRAQQACQFQEALARRPSLCQRLPPVKGQGRYRPSPRLGLPHVSQIFGRGLATMPNGSSLPNKRTSTCKVRAPTSTPPPGYTLGQPIVFISLQGALGGIPRPCVPLTGVRNQLREKEICR